MTVAVVALAVVVVLLAAAVGVLVRTNENERHDWTNERRMLLDRVIATHVGEIVALDRTAGVNRKESRPDQLRPVAEGL